MAFGLLRPPARGLLFCVLVGASGEGWAHDTNLQPLTEADHNELVSTQSVLPLEDLRVFTKAYDYIRKSYIEEISDKELLEYAIRGMLGELDPHSGYLDADSFDDLQVHTTGEFGGLGIEVGMENGFVKVISPIDDTPAQKAGIEAGDLIVKIDETAIKGLSLNEAVDKMRGPKGSKVVLTIIRDGTDLPLEIALTRDIIKVKSVRSEVLEDDFAYVRIAQFQLKTGQELKDQLKKLDLPKRHGIVLDLRNNPGGLLQASVDVADAFLDGGLVVYTEGRLSESNVQFNAQPGDLTDGLAMIVLINEGSASASEIVAGALQDHRRALVLGTRSFGKGSVQTVIPVTEDKAIKITTARYYTPKGRSIQAEGIAPDLVIERAKVTALDKLPTMSEAQLAGHLDNTQRKPAKKPSPNDLGPDAGDPKQAPLQSRDNQLYEAVNILKSLYLLQREREPLVRPTGEER